MLKTLFTGKKLSIQDKYNLIRMAVAIGIGLAFAIVLICLTADEPGKALKLFFTSPFMLANGKFAPTHIVQLIQKMVPMLFTGAAVCIMFSANQFNLGLEGSFYMGGLAAALITIYVVHDIPYLSPIAGIALGGVAGMLVMLIPALLQRLVGADVMVSSLMMNYVCRFFGVWVLMDNIKDPTSSNYSLPIGDNSMLKNLFWINKQTSSGVTTGLLYALIFVALAYVLLYKTRLGYTFRITGQNPNFAKYAGISVAAVAMLSQLIGGFIGGVGGAVYMTAFFTRFNWVDLTGFGWDGVTIAIFAKNNPKNLPIAVLFIAYLRTGAFYMALSSGVMHEITAMVEGVIILFLLAEQFLFKTYRRMVFKEADARRRIEEQKQLAGGIK